MNLLHVDSSLFQDNSVSRELSARIVEQFALSRPDLAVTYRDAGSNPPPHLTADLFVADRPQTEATRVSRQILDEFLAADVVVIGAPMYNFSIPSSLKSWLDHVLKAGATFRYTAEGPVGLAGDKQVIVASARGGIYSTGPAVAMDQQESLLRSAFGLMGIDKLQFVRAEGLAMGPEHRERAMNEAARAVRNLHTVAAAA